MYPIMAWAAGGRGITRPSFTIERLNGYVPPRTRDKQHTQALGS